MTVYNVIQQFGETVNATSVETMVGVTSAKQSCLLATYYQSQFMLSVELTLHFIIRMTPSDF